MILAGMAGLASRAFGRTQGMLIHLSCGAIGVKANTDEAIAYAAKYGFDAIDADGKYLAGLSQSDATRLVDTMAAKKVTWAMAGLPVDFRKDDAAFAESMKSFPDFAAGLKRAGVTRCTTWISPGSKELTYLENLHAHARRLRDAAGVLQDNGVKLGLEYVAPKTLWSAQRYPFVHTMAEMKELIAEIGKPNVGFVLDSWHWYTSGEAKKDLLTLRGNQVISVDLNDAPAGIPIDQQIDSKRELPAATGVIDARSFLSALKEIGFDGPVRAEPFNEAVRKMTPDQAIAATKSAIDKAFATL
ncbi:MAG: Xylose isomerase domain protein barrel [Candidatus Solibacter sp.]|nr:Xylose isomerase domain protein barrel [Candidatus Solibacter sp.]